MKNVTWEEIEGSYDQLTNFTETSELTEKDEELVTGGVRIPYEAIVAAVIGTATFFYNMGKDAALRDNARDCANGIDCGCP